MILISSPSVYISLTTSYSECHITELGLHANVVVRLHAALENQGLILASQRLFSSLLRPHGLQIYINGVYYMGIKAFNHLPSHIKELLDNNKKFKNILKNYLLLNSFYSAKDFFVNSNH
jgi:hypothetical protein